MEFFIFIIIMGAVAGPVIWLLVWIFIIRKAVQVVNDHVQEYEREQRELAELIQRGLQFRGRQMPPELNQQVLTKLMTMKNHMAQMNNLQRQKYETNMSGMMNSVIGAGFTNFNPSSFY